MTNGLISRLREFFHRLRSLFRAKQIDAELDAEMAAHLELAMKENLRRGLAEVCSRPRNGIARCARCRLSMN